MVHKNQVVKTSKFLSFVLRHHPDSIGLILDEAGWAEVAELLEKARRAGKALTMELLEYVVAHNDKKRFEFNADHSRIRASQGHSIAVELGYRPETPPETLYHGTALRFLESIRQQGLIKGNRHHVHLSTDRQTMLEVGARHGQPVLLTINAGKMHRDGFEFYLSTNRVWLVDHVPVDYIAFPEE